MNQTTLQVSYEGNQAKVIIHFEDGKTHEIGTIIDDKDNPDKGVSDHVRLKRTVIITSILSLLKSLAEFIPEKDWTKAKKEEKTTSNENA